MDATLYGFSQQKLVDYLWKSADDFKLQIVFTTHSPIILKQVNKYQRREWAENGIARPLYAYDSSIVYLEPKYDDEGNRRIMPRNISSSNDLNVVLNDINLTTPANGNSMNIYCEDARAVAFTQYILSKALGINVDLYMNFVDINLGWTNYVHLYEKKVPEFRNSIVILDGDVPKKKEYKSKEKVIAESENFLFLPLVIEKDLFVKLKDHAAFNRFQENYSTVRTLSYEICFKNWPLEPERYATVDFKHWFEYLEEILGDQEILYSFWCDECHEKFDEFVDRFVNTFNLLADRKEMDPLPTHSPFEKVEDQD